MFGAGWPMSPKNNLLILSRRYFPWLPRIGPSLLLEVVRLPVQYHLQDRGVML